VSETGFPYVSYKMNIPSAFSSLFVDPVTNIGALYTDALLFAALFTVSFYFFMNRKMDPVPSKDDVVETEERPVEPERLAPIRVPKQRKSFRQLHEYLADGQLIRHRVRGYPYMYACYEAASKRIVCSDGTFVKSLSAFAVHNIRQTNPNLPKPQADGWARCEVQIDEDTWVRANTLAIV